MASWFLIVVGVAMTTLLVAANPVVKPTPLTEKEEKVASATKQSKPVNQPQLPPQDLTSAKVSKTPGRMQSSQKGKAAKTVDGNHAIGDPRPAKTAPFRPSSAADRAPPGEMGKQRVPPPNVPGVGGLIRGGGTGGSGTGGSKEGKMRGGGKGGGGRGGGTPGGAGNDAARLQQLRGPPPPPSSEDASLRYLLTEPVDTAGLQNGEQQQQQPSLAGGDSVGGLRGGPSSSVDRLSGFALSDAPPLAMAEYLMLTGDFNGLDDALADIVAIGMMAPDEAEAYRDTVRLEYDSLLRQEAANADNEYQQADDLLRGGVQPFLPPLAIEYPDYSYYGNQAVDNGRGGPFNPVGYYGPSLQGDKLDEVLQQMLDSIASSYTVTSSEENGPYKSSPSLKTPPSSSSSSSSSSALEDQLKSLDQSIEEQTKGKTGGPKGGAGKGGAGKGRGPGAGGRGVGGAGGEKGRGKGGGGKPRKQDAKPSDVEKAVKPVASQLPQNKTKEANSTKSRRPLSKEETSP